MTVPSSTLVAPAQVTNNWFERDKKISHQIIIKKFLDTFGYARGTGKQATDVIRIKELIQIIEREKIQLDPHWKESEIAFKQAFKKLLREVGCMSQKRTIEQASSSSSTTAEEPEAKKRKLTTTTQPDMSVQLHPILADPSVRIINSEVQALFNNSVLKELYTQTAAFGTPLPLVVCQLIESYHLNQSPDEFKVEEYIRAQCCQKRISCRALDEARQFMKTNNIDPATICNLTTYRFNWAVIVTAPHGDRVKGFGERECIPAPMAMIMTMAPHLKELEIAHPDSDCFHLFAYLEELITLKTLSLSKSPHINDTFIQKWINTDNSDLTSFKKLLFLPKLTTLYLHDCPISQQMQEKLLLLRPNLKIVNSSPILH